MPLTASRPKPSCSGWRNASSRFGPVVPLVPARESTWQEPQFLTNICLPATRSGSFSVPAQPDARTDSPAARAATDAARSVLLDVGERIGAHAIHPRGGLCASSGAVSARFGEPAEVPLGRRDDPVGDALPAEALAAPASKRFAALRAPRLGPRQPAGEAARERL